MRIALLKPETSYSLSKMLYTKQVAERPVWKYLFIAGYIAYRLTGEACADMEAWRHKVKQRRGENDENKSSKTIREEGP